MPLMTASTYNKYGTSEVLSLSEIDMPTCGPDEILVKVKAATVNRTDCAMLTAKPWIMRFFTGCFKPKNPILGTDFAGDIVQVGTEVIEFSINDKVFGFHDMGVSSHAQYLKISKDKPILQMPTNCTYSQAVGLCEGAHYAYNTFKKIDVKAGQKILVNGGTGAIGSALIQMLKSKGAVITATSRTQHLEIVKKMGAETTIDYTKDNFEILEEQFEIIFDAVGKSTFGKCKKLLTKKGIYISSELGPWMQNVIFAITTPIFGGKKVLFHIPNKIKESLLFVRGLFEAQLFDPLIDREFSLDSIPAAFDYALTGQKVGNIIVKY